MKRKLSRKAAYIMTGMIVLALTAGIVVAGVLEKGRLTGIVVIRAFIPLWLCIPAFARIYAGPGGARSLSFFEKQYEKEIGSAFPEPDRKSEKKRLLKGIKAYNENRHYQALKHLTGLLDSCKNPADYAATYLFIALCYDDLKQPEKVKEAYNCLLDHDPSSSRAFSNLGMVYAAEGDTEKAKYCYARAIETDSENPYAYNNMAQLCIRLGRWREAIPYAERALALKSNLHAAANALAIAHYAVGERAESRRYVDISVLNGGDREALENIFHMMDHGTSPFETYVRLPEEIKEGVELFRRQNARPMAHLCLPAEGVNLGRSRVGGPPVGDAPTDSHGYPMRLLAAIWCSEVSGVPDFPGHGVLRFFIADDVAFGCDRHRPTEQSDFRVLYTEDEDAFGESPVISDLSPTESFPVHGCFPIYFQPGMSTPLASNDCFKSLMNESLHKAGAATLEEMGLFYANAVYSQNTWGGHRVGGYPCFEDIDPRSYEPYRVYDTLLLQIVSHTVTIRQSGRQEDLIRFGNDGGCQFFIPREKLRALDFSDILYWWDEIPGEPSGP